MELLLFAQAEFVGGSASQWAANGLLGLVLSWFLFKRLPDNDRQLADLLDKKDKQLIDQQKTMNEEYNRQMATVVLHCKDEMAGLHEVFRLQIQELGNKIAVAIERGK